MSWGAGFTSDQLTTGLAYLGADLDDQWNVFFIKGGARCKIGVIHSQSSVGGFHVLRASCQLKHKNSEGVRCRCSLAYSSVRLSALHDRESKLYRFQIAEQNRKIDPVSSSSQSICFMSP